MMRGCLGWDGGFFFLVFLDLSFVIGVMLGGGWLWYCCLGGFS